MRFVCGAAMNMWTAARQNSNDILAPAARKRAAADIAAVAPQTSAEWPRRGRSRHPLLRSRRQKRGERTLARWDESAASRASVSVLHAAAARQAGSQRNSGEEFYAGEVIGNEQNKNMAGRKLNTCCVRCIARRPIQGMNREIQLGSMPLEEPCLCQDLRIEERWACSKS